MVRVWYMDDSDDDQRLPHMTDPVCFVDLEELKEKTGILYMQINDTSDVDNDPQLSAIKKERGYTYEDEVRLSESAPNYEKMIKMFFEEHMHADEEIRLVLDGRGYFDARDKEDRWMRIEVTAGDMIILPAGIYHRFTLDTDNRIVARRYFVGEPVWTPHNRSECTDEMDVRMKYVAEMGLTPA